VKVAATCRVSLFLLGAAAACWATSTAAQPIRLEVASASAAFDQRTGEPLVVFKLIEPSTRAFADFTARNVGRRTEFRVDGRVHMRVVVREPIIGGSGQIAAGLSADEVRALAARLSSGTVIEIEAVAD
jgi:preprotein translocase subunit SecD